MHEALSPPPAEQSPPTSPPRRASSCGGSVARAQAKDATRQQRRSLPAHDTLAPTPRSPSRSPISTRVSRLFRLQAGGQGRAEPGWLPRGPPLAIAATHSPQTTCGSCRRTCTQQAHAHAHTCLLAARSASHCAAPAWNSSTIVEPPNAKYPTWGSVKGGRAVAGDAAAACISPQRKRSQPAPLLPSAPPAPPPPSTECCPPPAAKRAAHAAVGAGRTQARSAACRAPRRARRRPGARTVAPTATYATRP